MEEKGEDNTNEPFKIFIGGVPTDVKKEELIAFLQKHTNKFTLEMKQRHNKASLNLGFAILIADDIATYNYFLGLGRVHFRGKLIELKKFLDGKKLEKMLETQEETRLIATGVPIDIEEKQLILFFSKYGKIENFYFVKDFKCRQKTGNVVIIFKDIQESRSLLKKSVFIMNQSAVHIQRSETIRDKNKKKKKIKKRMLSWEKKTTLNRRHQQRKVTPLNCWTKRV